MIDLGSGTGAVGLAAAALGASSVVLIDLPHLLPLLRRNIALNGLAQTVSACELRWGDDAASAALHPPFDLVLASDVVYEAECIDPLIATLVALAGPSAEVLVANEHRPKLPFPTERLAAAGLLVSKVPQEEHHPEWRSPDIQIYTLKLQAKE